MLSSGVATSDLRSKIMNEEKGIQGHIRGIYNFNTSMAIRSFERFNQLT